MAINLLIDCIEQSLTNDFPNSSEYSLVRGSRKLPPVREFRRRAVSAPTEGSDKADDKKYICTHEGCDYRSNRAGNLATHLKRHEKWAREAEEADDKDELALDPPEIKRRGSASASGSVKSLVCPHPGCDYTSNRGGNMKLHVRRHTGEKPFACPHAGCRYRSIDGSNMKVHARRHSGGDMGGEFETLCDVDGCDYLASNRTDLRLHKKSHDHEDSDAVHEVEPASCAVSGCEFVASSERHMQLHLLTHSSPEAVPCPEKGCTFKTSASSQMRRHKKTHNSYGTRDLHRPETQL